MEELREKLAKFAGFTWKSQIFHNQATGQDRLGFRFIDLNGKEYDICLSTNEGLPFPSSLDFPHDLNTCFKWFEKPLVDHFIMTTQTENEYRRAYHDFLDEWLNDYIWNEPHKPALSICRAVERLIDKLKKEARK